MSELTEFKKNYNASFVIKLLSKYLKFFDNEINSQPGKDQEIYLIEQSLFNITHYLLTNYKNEIINELDNELLIYLEELTKYINNLNKKINENNNYYDYREITTKFEIDNKFETQINNIVDYYTFFTTLYYHTDSDNEIDNNIKKDLKNLIVFQLHEHNISKFNNTYILIES